MPSSTNLELRAAKVTVALLDQLERGEEIDARMRPSWEALFAFAQVLNKQSITRSPVTARAPTSQLPQ